MSKYVDDLDELVYSGQESPLVISFDISKFFQVIGEIREGLERLDSIDNSDSSEVLECLGKLDDIFYLVKYRKTPDGTSEEYEFHPSHTEEYDVIENYILKAQDLEKENELLKEIIKSFFDRGCPLHQYIDNEFGLTIEVDDECSIMHLGEFKGIDLNKKLEEILKNE